MRHTYDLDGVICSASRWFFQNMDAQVEAGIITETQRCEMEIAYCESRQVLLNPHKFLGKGDVGCILTGRRSWLTHVTHDWLMFNGIHIPITFSDYYNSISWTDYAESSRRLAELKAQNIRNFNADVHFDNNTFIVEALRELLPHTTIIQVNG